MRSDSESQQEREWALSQGRSGTSEGVCISVDWVGRLVEVNSSGITTLMPWKGAPPWPGDPVRVITAGLRPVCELIEGAPMGTVQTTGSGRANVLGDDGQMYSYPYAGGAPANAARVRLDHAGRIVLGTYSSEPPGSMFVPPAPPPSQGGSGWFIPSWSGNWSNGADSGAAVEISDSRTAAYGYRTSIADTIPDASTITRAELHLVQNWDKYPGVRSSLGGHGQVDRPGSMGDGSLFDALSVPGGSQAVDVQGAIANGLKTGEYVGVGFRSKNGWRQYAAAPASGRIYMEWS